MFDFTQLDLNLIWFILVGVLFGGYAILDGFDLGVGALHLILAKTDEERRILINAIGPVWDGNEVWLVTGGGALFAAFPNVYATVASGFYLAVMLLLIGLIFRAVSIEFRSKIALPLWRQVWDVSFCVSSIVVSLILGVALGNLIKGIPLNAAGDYTGTFFQLLNPYALLIGIMTVSFFMMHGVLYLLLKTEGAFRNRIRRLADTCSVSFIVIYILATMITLIYFPFMGAPVKENPILILIPVFNILAIANIPYRVFQKQYFFAFLSSCVTILTLLLLVGIGMFPNLVYSTSNPAFSLTIYNASSSARALNYMLNIAALGMPFVLVYTVVIYRVFRGKVSLTKDSY